MVTRDEVFTALEAVIDPELRKDVVTLGMAKEVLIDEATGVVTVRIALTTPGCPLKGSFNDQVQQFVSPLEGVTKVNLEFGALSQEEKAALRVQLREGIEVRDAKLAVPMKTRVIAVASGKGGVGKSTLTANLALAMAARGHEVGVIDADVYGYSIPQMLGIQQRPVTVDQMIVPPIAHGVRCMSIGFFLEQGEPVMWRGPMLHRALEQFLSDVHWGDLDYLFIDMPPGTGDIAISLGQLLPRSEALVVTTPQLAAQTVAQRAAQMAKNVGQSVLGVVENMSGIDGQPSIFGSGGGAALAEAVGVELLGTIPLDEPVRVGGDSGVPVFVAAPDAVSSRAIIALAEVIESIPGPTPPPPAPKDRIKSPLTLA